MNIYENMIILNAGISDEEAEAAVTKIKDLVTSQGGEVLKVDVWGRKKLAFEIKKQKKGLYVLLYYKTPAATVKKLEEFYKVSDSVLKYMVVKLEKKQIKDLEKIEPAAEAPAEPKVEA
ncbi:MAG TPA: 30S ribosomal protein S6 [Thermodesulfovibrionales bacterium]|nr:30S ribosomal protein S6 [Thermodesulfovibrionales bacterium]